MRKLIFGTIIIMVFALAHLTFAEEMNGSIMGQGMMGKGMMKGKMMHQGGMMGMCPRHVMMGKSTLVASNDGGVILLVGNKLYKYDKNLKLVKEVEIKIETSETSSMKGMKQICPMCQRMMDKEGMMEGSSDEKDQVSEQEKSEHEGHH